MINREMREGMERVGQDSVFVLQNHAPFRSGRLSDNIEVSSRGHSIRTPNIEISVAADEKGFSYVNVTRFGRRAVHAKRSRPDFRPEAGSGASRLARTSAAGSGQRRPFRRMTLAFEPGLPGSGFIYRHSVRAYHPRGDWVGESIPEIQQLAQKESDKITNWIDHFMNGSPRPSGARTASVRRTSRTGRLRSG